MKLWLCLVFFAGALSAQSTYTFYAPPPPAVSGVTAQASQTGFGSYCWWVVATYPIGKSPASQPACLTGVGGTVTVRWGAMPGATSYDVLRTSGQSLPSGTASIAVATLVAGTSQTDSLGALAAYTLTGAAGATANIKLDNLNYATPGLYQNINNGAYSALGTGGGGATWTVTALGNITGPTTLTVGSSWQIFTGTITGNVTLTASGAGTAGFILQLTQDGTGSHTLTCDASFASCGVLDPTAGDVSTQGFAWSGTVAYPQGAMTSTAGASAIIGSAGVYPLPSTPQTLGGNTRTISVTFDGGGSALSGTTTRCGLVNYAGTIQQASIIADQSGNATVDVKTVAYGSYTGPASASSITAAATPAIAAAVKYQDSTLTGWTTGIAANTVVCFVLSAPATVTWVQANLKVAAQ